MQIKGEKVEGVADFLCVGSQITTDGNCSHEIRRRLLPGRKVMTNLDSVLKSRGITPLTKVLTVKVMVLDFGAKSPGLSSELPLTGLEILNRFLSY